MHLFKPVPVCVSKDGHTAVTIGDSLVKQSEVPSKSLFHYITSWVFYSTHAHISESQFVFMLISNM